MTMLAHTFGDRGSAYQAGLYLFGRRVLDEAPVTVKYELLTALYEQNGLYTDAGRYLRDQNEWAPEIKALGNVTNEVVEFYSQNLLVGDLKLQSENQAILAPIDQFWRWSNFDAEKLVLSRQLPMLGDVFAQVATTADKRRVYMTTIGPANVVAFDVDNRKFVTWIRIETPMTRRLPNGKTERYTDVVIWSKAEMSYRHWEYRENQKPISAVDDDIARLGPPLDELPLSAFGIDFVPVVHIPFRRVPGDIRGQAAVWPSIEKIVELDLIITSLHQTSFAYDRPTWAIESDGRDPNNRPIPPPVITGATGTASGSEAVMMGRDKLFRLPAGWHLSSTVPDINFEAQLKIAQDYRATLERERPELIYGRLADLGGQISGRALRLMMTKAIKARDEALANVEQGLVRLNQMALTVMQAVGLAGSEIGSFTATSPSQNFDHRFEQRPMLPPDPTEDAETEEIRARAYQALITAGFPAGAALQRVYHYTEAEAAEMVSAQAAAVGGDDEDEGEQ